MLRPILKSPNLKSISQSTNPQMLILSLDTTTKAGSAAVLRDDEILAVAAGNGERTHGERLPGEIAAVLGRAGVAASALDLLVVASGPGAFTGLRIGLASMQGLAMSLDKPVIGVSALDALAWTMLQAGQEPGVAIATWMDAQRGEVYAAMYDAADREDLHPWRVRQAPIVGPPDAIARGLLALHAGPVRAVGDGAIRFRDMLEAVSPDWTVEPDVPLLAPALAWIGRRGAARGEAGPPHALQPLYVRRPDAELERERRARS